MTPAVAAPVVLDAWGGPDHAPVLLLPTASPTPAPCWADAIERWRQTFSVVTWDARGHGRSPRFTADQLAVGPGALMVADAVTAAEQLAARSGAAIGVVGHSMGGSTAAGLALARPDLGPPWSWRTRPSPVCRAVPARTRPSGGGAGARAAADRCGARRVARSGPAEAPAVAVERVRPVAPGQADTDLGMTANGRILNEDNAFEVARLLAVPTLVVTGTDGVIWHADAVAALRSAAGPQVRVEVLEGGTTASGGPGRRSSMRSSTRMLRERLGVR